ncbi:unnamed protein product [Candidula unifasciata]|uniref:Inositol polyphosphate-related phosphatase domain-containing protein n=1 Tax=Candidula unifasciata TaxID=100452 RepID=A0A8S3Z509_9EUPU|nr:unnamed protein product [Candidula unifasciata]
MQSSAMTVEAEDEHKKNTNPTNPRSRSKKKSTLTKLKEKKQKELASTGSLRKEDDCLLASEDSKNPNERPKEIPCVDSDGDKELLDKDGRSFSTKDHLQDLGLSNRPRPLPRGRRQSLELAENVSDKTQGIREPAKDSDGKNKREIADNATVKIIKHINMNSGQLDSVESKLGSVGSMLDSVGSTVSQSSFIPRPPATPRTPRSTPRTPRGLLLVGKGEKRFREPGSSGDEPEVEQKKEKSNIINHVIKAMETENVEEIKHSADAINITDTVHVHKEKSTSFQGSEQSVNKARFRRRSSNTRIESLSQETKNDIGKPPVDHTSVHSGSHNTNSNNGKKASKASSADIDEFVFQETIQNIPHEAGNSPRGNYTSRSLVKKASSPSNSSISVGLSNAHLSSSHLSPKAGGSDEASSTHDKADDALLMLNDLLLSDSNTGIQLTQPLNKLESPVKVHSISSPPRVPRLDPISPRSYPPPLPEELSSKSLRTMYKIDPDVHPRSMMGHSGSSSNKTDSASNSNGDHLSQKSFHSISVLPVITTKEARSRNTYDGSIALSALGTYELDRYFPERKVNVFVGTWNMNELKDLKTSIDDFILPERCDYVQDIYAIGTQENNMAKKEWEITVQETIGPSHVLFHSVSLGSLHLAVFIRRDLIWFCSDPEDDAISLRAVTMVKTKGAIGICFSLFGTSYLFINCHLTSDRDNETSRKKSRLGDYCKVITEMKLPKSSSNSPSGKPADVTSVFDCIFWFGDLNFRIERKRHAVERKVNQITSEEFPNFETLLGGDQLLNYMAEGKIFGGFQEGRINFHPTFKFDINSDTYDSSSKNRVPSYTDRIMFRSKKKHDITCLHYDAVMTIKASDHRPVYGQFETVIKPGRDNMVYSVGHFDRAVYMEALQRRTATLPTKRKQSVICTIQ